MSKKNNKRTGKGYGKRTKIVPDWLREQKEQDSMQQPQQTQNDESQDNKKRFDEILKGSKI